MTTEQPINIFAPGFRFISEIKHASTNFIYPEWSPDGSILALGPDSGSYALWYRKTSELEFRRLDAFAGSHKIKWSPDGQKLAIACTMDGIIQIQTLAKPIIKWDDWDKWRTNINTFPPYIDGRTTEGTIKDIKWMPNGKQVITAHESHDVIMWDIEKAEVMQRFNAYPGISSISVAVSPDGKLITTNDGKILRIRDTNNFEKVIVEIPGDWYVANVIDWSANGQFIAIGTFGSGIRILDTQSWKWVQELREPKEQINSVKFSPKGDFLAATGEDNIFRLWNCNNWLQKIQVPDLTDGFNQLSFHPSETMIATSAKGKVKLWEYDPYQFS